MNGKQAYVQNYGSAESTPGEFHDVLQILQDRCVPVEVFTKKRIDRRQLPISAHETLLVVGDHDTMKAAFQALGVPKEEEESDYVGKKKSSRRKQTLSRAILPSDCYPPPLRKYMGRKIYETTQANLLDEIRMKGGLKIFVKPRQDIKKFTGRVISTLCDIQSLPSDIELYACDCVDFRAEFRVFVLEGQMVGVRCYKGDDSLQRKMDMAIVKSAIDDLEASSYKTAAYALDFGLVCCSGVSQDEARTKNNGQNVESSFDTLFVEWNDAYSLGSYGLSSEHYTDMLIARWEEVALHVRRASTKDQT